MQTTSLVFLELKRDLVLRDVGVGRETSMNCGESNLRHREEDTAQKQKRQFLPDLLSSEWGT